MKYKIACISDVHNKWHNIKVPECDILISAGDYSSRGEHYSVLGFHNWLNKQPAKHKISVQGNHEIYVENNYEVAKELVPSDIHFVEYGKLVIDGIKFYCSAATPIFCNWAYMMSEKEIEQHWAEIPDDTEVLVTHGPPFGFLDQINHLKSPPLGCRKLRKRVEQLKKLKLHVFGHIHGSAGATFYNGTTFINASICNEAYEPVNPVRIFNLEVNK